MIQSNELVIRERLLELGAKIDPKELFPVVIPEAQGFVVSNPYAFIIAACLDRGTKSEIIWTIPFDLKRELGHLDPHRINSISTEALRNLFQQLPRKPRFINDAPSTLKELTRIVVSEFDGDTSKIWQGRNAATVKRTLQGIYGVGEGIANMTVLLIEKAFGFQFSGLDRPNIDIKADVHTIRVLYRLGTSGIRNANAAIRTARRLNPDYPGALDAPLWVIGRRWCHEENPKCTECYMNDICPKEGLERVVQPSS